MDTYLVNSSVLHPSDLRLIERSFARRICFNLSGNQRTCHSLHNCELRFVYSDDGVKQAFLVKESNAHVPRCICSVCNRVRELLCGPSQFLTGKNIWLPASRLLPFNVNEREKLFLAYVGHNIDEHINSDPAPTTLDKGSRIIPYVNGAVYNPYRTWTVRNVSHNPWINPVRGLLS